MHYYKKNIGDYHKKAGRLSMIEHGAYTLLLDACYDRERFPTEEEAIDWAWARTKEEEEAVRFVLSRFFVLQDGFYVQERIREEVEKYHQNAETNARIAQAREAKRRGNNVSSTNRAPTVNEPPPNQEPRTINQEPSLIKDSADKPQAPAKASRKSSVSKPDSVEQQVWDDFLTMRKAKGAPVTETALKKLAAEADKARMSVQQALETCCAQGWRGFKAEWVQGKAMQQSRQMPPMKSFAEQDRDHQMARWEEMTGRVHPDRQKVMNGCVIDITPAQNSGLFLEN